MHPTWASLIKTAQKADAALKINVISWKSVYFAFQVSLTGDQLVVQ